MPFALILSSYVAASRVGGGAQALALMPFGIDAAVIPSVLFGRHPGWGAPGGGAVEARTMREMIDAVAANGLNAQTDAVISGYFVDAEQVRLAGETIDRIRAAQPLTRVVVDPVLGDAGRGFFVSEEVRQAVRDELVPRADLVTPNVFELEFLAGRPLEGGLPDIIAAARGLKRPALVTSAPGREGEIGALYIDETNAVLAAHRRLKTVPQGTGDLICALYTAAWIEGLAPAAALERATRATAEAVEAADAWRAPELPIVALGDRLVRPTAEVRIETLA
jgi:pyridoxine kinase